MSKRKLPASIPAQTGGAAAEATDNVIPQGVCDPATVPTVVSPNGSAKIQCSIADEDSDSSTPASPCAQRPPGTYPATPEAKRLAVEERLRAAAAAQSKEEEEKLQAEVSAHPALVAARMAAEQSPPQRRTVPKGSPADIFLQTAGGGPACPASPEMQVRVGLALIVCGVCNRCMCVGYDVRFEGCSTRQMEQEENIVSSGHCSTAGSGQSSHCEEEHHLEGRARRVQSVHLG